jgi:hypothetical protein
MVSRSMNQCNENQVRWLIPKKSTLLAEYWKALATIIVYNSNGNCKYESGRGAEKEFVFSSWFSRGLCVCITEIGCITCLLYPMPAVSHVCQGSRNWKFRKCRHLMYAFCFWEWYRLKVMGHLLEPTMHIPACWCILTSTMLCQLHTRM